jgi:demethylmenaquinone methyltransferase/2-methoxy-6-polyprenyl-1,4-benzoquinol methylase
MLHQCFADGAVSDQHFALAICKTKIGGRALILEFSRVKADFLRPLYDFHSFEVLPRLGRLIAGDEASYRYLAESIRKHPDQDALKAMMEATGLARVDVRNLAAGIVAIHRGYRV